MYGVFTYDCGALPKHYASYRDLGDANREVDYLTNIGVRAWVFKRNTPPWPQTKVGAGDGEDL